MRADEKHIILRAINNSPMVLALKVKGFDKIDPPEIVDLEGRPFLIHFVKS
jgi:hypothetical protein